jgi:hypothetical protein
MLPGSDMIDQYDMLEVFIRTVKDEEIYDQLQDWFKFRDENYRNVALRFCRKHNLAWRE